MTYLAWMTPWKGPPVLSRTFMNPWLQVAVTEGDREDASASTHNPWTQQR